METKRIRHGTHIPNDDHNGYMYALNDTRSSTDYASHIHSCYEIIHIISGNLIYTVEGAEYYVGGGDIVMTAPDELHSFVFTEEGRYKREFIHIYPGFIAGVPEIAAALNERKIGTYNHIPKDKVEKYGFDKIFEDVRSVCENPSSDTDLIVFANIALFAAKAHLMLTNDAPEYPKREKNSRAALIYDYIDFHYMEDINAGTIAAVMAMSETSVRRTFKRETGMTIKTYLMLRRVTAAKHLMMEGRKAMNIFTQCGFGDYSTFYRSFIKYVGMTPDEFKHRHDDRKKKLAGTAPVFK